MHGNRQTFTAHLATMILRGVFRLRLRLFSILCLVFIILVVRSYFTLFNYNVKEHKSYNPEYDAIEMYDPEQLEKEDSLNKLNAEVIFNNDKDHGNSSQIQEPTKLLKLFRDAFRNLSTYRGRSTYNINESVSISVGAVRPLLADTRVPVCKSEDTKAREIHVSQKASIVVPFYMEHWSVLLRMLYNLYKVTDLDLVEDIILVDDFNEGEAFAKPLRVYLRSLPKLTLLRTLKREGLIRARMVGARAAMGDVLVIIDAHVEFNRNWLMPLLVEVTRNRSTIAVPALDHINPMTFIYSQWSSYAYGSFDWELDYLWITMPTEVERRFRSGQPIETATFLGCAMAVDRKYFFSIGGYDESLSIWGGESLELAFRTWMCGGRVVIVPCSKIGHLFRSHLPYLFSQTILTNNLQKVAEVWMDEHKKWFNFTTKPLHPLSEADRSAVHRRKLLRKRLKCHDFNWYLTNVAKGITVPKMPSVLSGFLRNLKWKLCINVDKISHQIRLRPCNQDPVQEVFHFRGSRLLEHSSGLCLTCDVINKTPKLEHCAASNYLQRWSFSPLFNSKLKAHLLGTEVRKPVGQLRWEFNNYESCLQVVAPKKQPELAVVSCNFDNAAQYWISAHKIHRHV